MVEGCGGKSAESGLLNYVLLLPDLDPENHNNTASTRMYLSGDFLDKSIKQNVVGLSGCGFGDLSFLLELMQVNRSDA